MDAPPPRAYQNEGGRGEPGRSLIGLTNVILPGKGLKRGPYTSQEELLAARRLEAILDPRNVSPGLLDQLRKGAALNTVQIAEALVANGVA